MSPMPTSPNLRAALRPPDNWLRCAFAGLEAAILSWLIAALGGLVTYVATAAAPGLGGSTWGTSVSVATGWWLTSFGSPMPSGEDGVLSLIPLACTLVSLLLLRGSMRRADVDSGVAAAIAGVAYLLSVGLLGLAAPERSGEYALGAILVAAVAALSVVPMRLARIPASVRQAIRSAWWSFLGILVVSGIAVTTAIAMGWSTVLEIHDSLGPSTVSSIVLILLQLAYAPLVAGWGFAWLAGPGFHVGTGSHFSPFGTTTEALPAIPVLGALPGPGTAPGWWVLLSLAAVGAVVGALRSRRSDLATPGANVLHLAVALPVFYVVSAVFVMLSSGSLGSGRMAEMGANAPLVALISTALVGAGLAVGLFARFLPGLVTSTIQGARSRRAATPQSPPDAIDESPASSAKEAPETAAGSPPSARRGFLSKVKALGRTRRAEEVPPSAPFELSALSPEDASGHPVTGSARRVQFPKVRSSGSPVSPATASPSSPGRRGSPSPASTPAPTAATPIIEYSAHSPVEADAPASPTAPRRPSQTPRGAADADR